MPSFLFKAFCSPLEQFEIVSVFGFMPFYFTNSSWILLFSFLVSVFFSQQILVFNGNLVPSRYQGVLEFIYKFVYNVVFENIGKSGDFLFPFILSLFLLLLLCNVFGLVPYSFTVTSHFIITFSLACFIWFGKLVFGFKKHGIRLFSLFLPSGVPLFMIPFFVIVEFLRFFIPLLALGVRLFANMMAGHILLKVIVGFSWSMLLSGTFFFFMHLVPMFVLFLLLFLETAVAFIQAYVFTMLASLLVGDCLRGGHL